MIHIGFTGTQNGMTQVQAERVWELVQHRQFVAHHGDCIGADKQFDWIVRHVSGCHHVVIHPPIIAHKRAFCEASLLRDEVRMPKDYLVRNHDIVEEATIMIATPKETSMQLRSGTWTTVRYALKAQRPLAIVFPNGAIAYDGPAWPA